MYKIYCVERAGDVFKSTVIKDGLDETNENAMSLALANIGSNFINQNHNWIGTHIGRLLYTASDIDDIKKQFILVALKDDEKFVLTEDIKSQMNRRIGCRFNVDILKETFEKAGFEFSEENNGDRDEQNLYASFLQLLQEQMEHTITETPF